MGNPASVIKKATEKRRKRFEARLGPGAYLPREEREKLNAVLKVADEAEKVRLADRAKRAATNQAAKRAKRMAAKHAPPAPAAPAPEAK